MTLMPAQGYMFVVPEDTIPATSKEVGFSGKTEKFKLEVPYKLRVVAVGAPRVTEYGESIFAQAKVGDLISSIKRNSSLRDDIEQSGFLLDGKQVLVMDFTDLIGIWREELLN